MAGEIDGDADGGLVELIGGEPNPVRSIPLFEDEVDVVDDGGIGVVGSFDGRRRVSKFMRKFPI